MTYNFMKQPSQSNKNKNFNLRFFSFAPAIFEGKKNVFFLAFVLLFNFSNNVKAQNELPSPTSNIMLIKNGSLVIAMDNTTQSVPGYFNLKAYGLVNKLLQSNIPVKWAIAAGKIKDGIDFSATAQREFPSVIAASTYNFKAGPFIIDSVNAQSARTIISAWGSNVAVYRLTQNVNVDIRYTLNFKPRIAVFNNGNNAKIHLSYLIEAGFDTSTYVRVIPELQPLNPCQNGSGFSFASEAHWDDQTDTAVSRSVYRFVKNGGNFLAACISIRLYENDDTLHTTGGIDAINDNYTFNYSNADLPFMQIDGELDNIGGALHNWYKKTTSNYRSSHYSVVSASTGLPYETAAGAKCIPNNLSGGNMFYLGGHSYGDKNVNVEINGRRMYLNAVFVPPGAAAYCNLQPLAASLAPVSVRCKGENNGSITTNISGGVAPYKCTWNSGDTTRNRNGLTPGTYSVTIIDNIGQTVSATATITEPAILVATNIVSNFNGKNVSCYNSTNGFINLNVTGGNVPYTFSWSPSGSTSQNLTNVGAGTYSYQVTDSRGCVTSSSATLSAPSQLISPRTVSNYNGNNVSCNGSTNGFINLSPTGGIAPYTYSWTPGGSTSQNLNNIGAGNYTYAVTDANGCTSTGTVTLTAPSALTTPNAISNYNGSGVSCTGSTNGFINLYVNGGTAPYSYFWSPGGNTSPNRANLGAGTYSYTVTDANGCSTSNSVTLTEPQPLAAPQTISNYNGSSISCYGSTNGFINIVASGGTSPFTYAWAQSASTLPNRTNLGAGTYSYTVTDANGCSTSNSATLTSPAALTSPQTVSNYNGNGVSCAGSSNGSISLTVTGGTSPYSYLWSPGGNTTSSRSNLSAGTYSYTVTDANGCSNSNSVTLSQPAAMSIPVVTSNYNGSGVSCLGSTDGFISLSVIGGTSPYSYNWSSTSASTPNLTNLSAGGYSYSVTDANGCAQTGSVVITAPADLSVLHVVSNYNGSSISCNGSANGSIDLTVSGGTTPYSYLWSPGGSTGQNLSNLGSGNYSYSVTDANGCVVANSVTLSSANSMSVPYTTSDYNGSSVTCFGATDGFINLSVIGGTSPFTYSWQPNVSTDSSLRNLGAGMYSFTVTDANGCTASDSVVLTEPVAINAPSVSSSYNGSGISCNGATNGYVNLLVSGGTGPYAYLWTPTGDTTSNLSNIGAGSYSCIVTDINGCSATDSITLTAPDSLLTLDVLSSYNGSGVSCFGSTDGNISLTVNGGTQPYTYNWLPNGDTTQNISNLASGAYSYTVTDANGCVFSNVVTLNAPNALTAPYAASNYNGSGVSCFGSSDGYINLTIGGGTAPFTYAWLPGGNTSQNVSGLQAGDYSFVVTDANGCSTSDSISLVAPNPIQHSLQLSNNNGYGVSCNGDSNGSIDLSVNGGTLPFVFNWMPGNLNTEDISGLSAGNYSVTISDANGCTSTLSTSITEPPSLSLSGISTQVNCHGDQTGSIRASVSGGVQGITYSWSNGSSDSLITSLGAGIYTLTATDVNGCSVSNSFTITEPSAINLAVSTPFLNGIYNVSCYGLSDGSASATVNGGVSPYTVLWSNGVTGMAISGLPANTYSVTIIDGNFCQTIETFNITQPAQIVSLPGFYQEVCGNTAILNANAITAGLFGSWSIQNGLGTFSSIVDPNASISGLRYGTNLLQWNITDGICSATDTVTIKAFQPVVAEAGSDAAICPSSIDGFILQATPAVAGSGYWFASGSALVYNSDSAFSKIGQLMEGNNVFTWTVTNGPCTASDEISVLLKSKDDCIDVLEMPTAFTPNADGSNDDFDIHGIEQYPNNTLEVYNRWGNLVYSADNYVNHQWTGNNNENNPLPDGTYFVILVIKNSQIRLHGYVDIRK